MSKGMLIMFAASLLSLGACGADLADDVDAQDENTLLEHRFGQGRCDDADEDDDERASKGGSDFEAFLRRGFGCGQKRDGGASKRDAGTSHGNGRSDAGSPATTRDAGRGPVVTRDAGTKPPTTRDAGGPVIDDNDDDQGGIDGPVIGGVDRDVITLSDGSVVRLDRSCPNYPTPFSVTLPGCCLPAGSCGLSTHELNVSGVPKGCFSYDQAKMLDPSFSMPAKSCQSK